MSTISKSFTATGSSGVLRVNEKETVDVALSGTYVASVQLEEAVAGNETVWRIIGGPWSTDDATVAHSFDTKPNGGKFRLTCTAYTSGTVVTTMADTDKVLHVIKDLSGNTVFEVTQAGVAVTGTQTVSGATTESAAKTLTVDDATNNAVTDVLTLEHTTTGSASAGIGVGIPFKIEDAGGSEEQARIDAVLRVVTDGAEDVDLVMKTNVAGAMKVMASVIADESGSGGAKLFQLGSDANQVQLDMHPPTTASGNLRIKATDSSTDVVVTLTNADHGQATEVVVPDVGLSTSYVVQSTAALTAAEANLLDGASVANATASKALVLDSTKRTVTTATAGSVGTGVTAVEYSADGINFTTVLTLTAVSITIGDNAALSMGALIYTLPAGDVAIKASSCSVGLNLTTGTPTSDTPEIGLGTVVGSGANATIGAVGTTSEDIMEGVVMADIAGTAKANMDQRPMDMLAGAAHTVYLNFADTWADVDDTTATADGTVTLSWSKLPLA
jgi:hypothetical protein